jgi:hypothetical protein
MNSLPHDSTSPGTRSEILICDVAGRASRRRLTPGNPNCWRPIPYATEDFAGVMLASGVGPRPMPITG